MLSQKNVSITLPDPFCFLLVRFHPIPRIFPCEACLLKGTGELLIPIIQYCAVKNNFSFSLSSHSVTIQLYRYRSHLSLSIAYFVFTRKFALSSMCQCGFCGTNLTRRSHNQDTHHMKTSLEMQNSNEQRD